MKEQKEAKRCAATVNPDFESLFKAPEVESRLKLDNLAEIAAYQESLDKLGANWRGKGGEKK
jgi:hypothetical protein